MNQLLTSVSTSAQYYSERIMHTQGVSMTFLLISHFFQQRPGPNAITTEFAKYRAIRSEIQCQADDLFASSIWKAFVPADEYHTVARGAYFSREVIPDQLVVVSLNTMYFCEPSRPCHRAISLAL